MRTSVVRIRIARAIASPARRSFALTRPRCCPDAETSKPNVVPDASAVHVEQLPFRFETGLALFAKRPPRPFPPPFLSPPSGSFSEPLSTHNRSRDRSLFVNGELIRGYTNGDDAVYGSDYFVAANDGVGAWSTRPGGHAGYALKDQTVIVKLITI
jgi:protein phosphatase PTC7